MILGKRLNDRYTIIRLIGGGGTANVYVAHDTILDREVAIKILRFDIENDEKYVKRFQREAQSATELNHPNIVTFYDVGEDDGIHYIVMEFVKGKTLKHYINKNAPISVEKAQKIMLQLATAMVHAHSSGLIHRDIKPQNILMDEEENCKVADFGIALAHSATTMTQTNTVLGSVHYLSPEQAKGGISTEKSDIYSLGIVFYELVTGELPFNSENAFSIVMQHLQKDIPSVRDFNKEIPQSIENIILKSTAKNPFYRYNSVEEMEEDLETALNEKRKNEKKFMVPTDDDMTKAIPIIRDPQSMKSVQTTQEFNASRNGHRERPVPEKPKKRNWTLILSLILAFLVVGGISIVTWIPALFLPKDVEVPDLTNMTYDDGLKKLIEVGLTLGEPKNINDEMIPDGSIIKTEPASGEIVKEKTPITLYRSLGKAKIEMPNFEDELYENVKSEIEGYQFKKVTIEEQNDEELKGTIIDQSVSPKEKVIASETELVLTVSNGPEKIILRDLTGYSEKSAIDYAKEEGIVLAVKRIFSDTVEKGLVISQSPLKSVAVDKGSELTVIISLGIAQQPNKIVTKVIDIPYQESEDGKELTAELYISDVNHDMTTPYKTYEPLTENKKESVVFTIKAGDKASYKVIINGEVVSEDSILYDNGTTPPDESSSTQ